MSKSLAGRHGVTGAGATSSGDDAFLLTELELSKAKRQFASLERRLDDERADFSKDYRRLSEQLLAEREKSASLQARVFELEAALHKDRLSGLSREEEDAARRRVLEEDIKRAKCKLESSVSLLEEELRSTKSAWARRLSEERQGWQTQALDKAGSLQSQLEQTRDYYKGQLEALHRELADLLATHRNTKEELECAVSELREEKRKKKALKMDLEESRDKYRRCLTLASDLVALRRARQGNTTEPLPPPPFHSLGVSHHTRPPRSSGTGDDTSLVRKQLHLTQVLLEEELRKNRELREQLATLKL